VVALALVWAAGPLAAGEAPPGKGKDEKVKRPLSPEEEAARTILQRYKAEHQVQKDQREHMARRHVAVAKAHFNNQAWSDALRHYEKAVDLDPDNKEAQEGLRKTRSMLSAGRRRFGELAKTYADQMRIALEVHRTELNNMFAAARGLFERGQYVDAIDAFTRAEAKANYLSPNIDVGKIAEEARVYIRKSLAGIEERKQREEAERLKRADQESRKLRKMRQDLLDERTRALYRQATVLFEKRRYEEARKVCDEILREDPTSGAAQSLLETTIEAGRNELIDRAVKARRVETERHWQETRAYCVPYTQVRPDMPRDRFEEVRSRISVTAIGGKVSEPEPWELLIRDKMNKKISFDFVETPLQDVIAFISSLVDLTIVLDSKALQDEPLNVTLRVNDMRLESALNWVLKLVGLRYTLKDEAIFVSKPEHIHDEPELRMYDVTDLTIDIKNFQGRQQALASDGGYSSTGSQQGGYGGESSLAEDFFSDEDEDEEEERLTGESLVEFIKKTIAPGTWADDAGVDEF